MIGIFVALLLVVILGFSIMMSAIKNKQFVCNRYILNTYLYVILSFVLLGLQVLSMEKLNVKLYSMSLLSFFLIFALTIGCISIIHILDPKKIILKHLVWALFIFLIGLLFYPLFIIYSKYKNHMMNTILTTILIFLVLSIVAFVKPELISFKLGPILFILLLTGIIFELLTLFFADKNRSMLLRGVSYFFIVVFMFYILYDTKRLQINAKNCVIADYIRESLGLFLDIYNIFIRLLTLRSR